MVSDDIRDELFGLRDVGYRSFQGGLIPTVGPEYFIGVRTPDLRKLAKKYAVREDIGAFLDELPHKYFDENQVHAFIISGMKNYQECVARVNEFLPYVDNWATCDQMSPRVFRKHRDELLGEIRAWLWSDRTYTVRFGIKMLMEHYLDEGFDVAYPEMVAAVRSEEYYVNMMRAWYFATALAKQWDATLPFIEGRRLRPATHNKAIQKAVESYRITPEQKVYLKTLKV